MTDTMTIPTLPADVAALIPDDAGPVRFAARTGTPVDAGLWFRGAPLWAVVRGDTLCLAAPGPRPFTEAAPLSDLSDSVYNHVTGQLVLAPARTLRTRGLDLPPVAALELLALIRP